jgi:hypothetical protein
MATRFSALPVSSGDAFLLQDRTNAYLFDGGRQRDQVAQLLLSSKIKRLNAVICSHNDADHANGVIGVLDSPIHVDEVWIPGRWVQFLASAAATHSVERPWWQSVVNELNERSPDNSSMRQLMQLYSAENDRGVPKAHGLADGGQCVARSLRQLQPAISVQHMISVATARRGNPQFHALSSLLQSGLRIYAIAQRAVHRNCRLRLFDFQDMLIDDDVIGTNFMSVNSREVRRLPVIGNTTHLLLLTIVNRESLVFRHVHRDDAPVLLCADSDFSFLRGAPFGLPKDTLATAPHHGSNENRFVYTYFPHNRFIWVRSDGTANGPRPCPEFLKQRTRYCTICRRSIRAKQRVDLDWKKGRWKAVANVQACCCR